jgi:adenosylcobinamide kinase/adenosylcobinamide-phosphate guanylyltransferase
MEEHRIVLIGGGVRSGKSTFATKLAHRLGDRRTFIATAMPVDDETRARIARHRSDRGESFTTVEEPLLLPEAIDSLTNVDVVVVDCLTIWLSNLLIGDIPMDAILVRVDKLVRVLSKRHQHSIIVTNEVGMSVHPPTPLGRAFVEACGWSHQRLARAADEIYVALLGTVLQIRPRIGPPDL